MKVLRIFDVSAFVHAGGVNRHSFLLPEIRDDGDFYRECKIRTGGTSMLWNVLYYEFGKCDMAFCMDRRPTIKQSMFAPYKGNREHNSELHKQKDACEYILRDCGFTVLAEDGYEADDFIHSLVQENRNVYDMIYIYCNDSDLYYLVDDNVEVLPSSSRAKNVTKQNYTYTVRNNMYTPYNILTYLKIINGDTSDNIPALRRGIVDQMNKCYNNEMYHKHLGDKSTVQFICSRVGEEAVAQCDLVFPLDVRVPNRFSPGDKLAVAEWGSAMRNKMWRTGDPPSGTIKDKIEEMVDLGFSTDD